MWYKLVYPLNGTRPSIRACDLAVLHKSLYPTVLAWPSTWECVAISKDTRAFGWLCDPSSILSNFHTAWHTGVYSAVIILIGLIGIYQIQGPFPNKQFSSSQLRLTGAPRCDVERPKFMTWHTIFAMLRRGGVDVTTSALNFLNFANWSISYSVAPAMNVASCSSNPIIRMGDGCYR
ncbi:Cell adhesion molecule 3 [Gossypium australe]|uniref:Cell adhesion molecule 3 n=1 Tax=Gossypium australe TaxID=47621 RepID=A0A5B6VZE1_9ROSI|nr:Cell adhesion molecule 3 [Gossypium australe]